MRYAINIYSMLVLLFVLLLTLSGSIPGAAGDAVYILAFILPSVIGLFAHRGLKRRREEERGLAEPEWYGIRLGADCVADLSLLSPIVIALILLVSALTSFLLGLFDMSDTLPERRGMLEMMIAHALVPAVLEELTFRYLPIKLLAPYSRRACALISSLYFALIHANIFKMPYAFLAGLIFVLLDLGMDSILPSVILHFLNNAASVVWMLYCEGAVAQTVYLSALGGLALLSTVALLVFRRKRIRGYLSLPREARGWIGELGRGPAAVAAVCLLSALLTMLS